jgi:hypothetical protein
MSNTSATSSYEPALAHYWNEGANDPQVPQQDLISTTEGEGIAALTAVRALDWLRIEQPAGGALSASIDVETWRYHGSFYKESARMLIAEESRFKGEEFDIVDLLVYPALYAVEEIVRELVARGKMFWKCRHRNYVAYTGIARDGIQNVVLPLPPNSTPGILTVLPDELEVHG